MKMSCCAICSKLAVTIETITNLDVKIDISLLTNQNQERNNSNCEMYFITLLNALIRKPAKEPAD